MKTPEQIRKALETFRWYVENKHHLGLESSNQDCVLGSLAVLEWVAGKESPSNPISGTIEQIEILRRSEDTYNN